MRNPVPRLSAALVLLSASAAWAADAGVPIAPARQATVHTFTYAPPAGQHPQHVDAAGDFNGWSTTATELSPQPDGTFATTVNLTDGPHQYKLVVDGKWMTDPADDPALRRDDNYGGKNSGLIAGMDADKLPPVRPDAIDAAAISFDPADVRDLDVVGDGTVRLSIRTRAGDVARVTVLFDGPDAPPPCDLGRMGTAHGLDRFAGLVSSGPGHTWVGGHYVFRLDKPGKSLFVAAGRAYAADPAARASYEMRQFPTFAAFDTPDWAKHAVWYQIFPERFRNGDPSNDPPHTLRWTSRWFDLQPGEVTAPAAFTPTSTTAATGATWPASASRCRTSASSASRPST